MSKMFPIQAQRGAAPHPLQIPWAVAELAYSVYAGRYGTSQSLADLAGRGGFGPNEMDTFLPGWREMVSEIAHLKFTIAAMADACKKTAEIMRRVVHKDAVPKFLIDAIAEAETIINQST